MNPKKELLRGVWVVYTGKVKLHSQSPNTVDRISRPKTLKPSLQALKLNPQPYTSENL